MRFIISEFPRCSWLSLLDGWLPGTTGPSGGTLRVPQTRFALTQGGVSGGFFAMLTCSVTTFPRVDNAVMSCCYHGVPSCQCFHYVQADGAAW